jgi:serine/threonine protein kinase
VKPGNILVRTDGVVKLTDFGIAKAADAVPVTRSGMVMGTAHYIAPEQASGAEAGPASDVYSLGIVGYECLAGQRPFRADSAVAVAMMQVREAPPPLPPNVPAGARELIEAALVKDPTLRYSTGGEFALAVAAVRRGEPLPPPGSVTGTISPPRTPSTPARAAPKTAPKAAPPSAPFPQSPPFSSPLSSPIPTRSTPPRRARPAPAPPTPARPAPVPPRRPAPDTGHTRRHQPAPAARHATPAQPARRASSQSFRLQPKSSGRTLLLVLFVLLTLAAVAVGVLLFRGGLPPIGSVNPTPQGAGPGTVAGREGVPTGSTVTGGLLSLVIVTGSAR